MKELHKNIAEFFFSLQPYFADEIPSLNNYKKHMCHVNWKIIFKLCLYTPIRLNKVASYDAVLKDFYTKKTVVISNLLHIKLFFI